MSDVKAIKHILHNHAAVIAAVPAVRIASDLPEGVELPAIEVSHITTIYRNFISGSSSDCRSRVQVTVHAKSRPSQKSILALCRTALDRQRGTINGVVVKSIIKDVIGPDFRNDEIRSFIGSQDFMIEYIE